MAKLACEEDTQGFGRHSWRREVVDENVPAISHEICFLGELTLGRDEGIFSGNVEKPSGNLP